MSKSHTCGECGLKFEGKHAIVTKNHVDSILCLECIDNLIDEDTKVLGYELEVDGKVVAKEGDMSDEDEREKITRHQCGFNQGSNHQSFCCS